MVLIFDLDDTLYAEISYVQGGFRAVADALHRQYGWDAAQTLAEMNDVLKDQGRGSVFDAVLAGHGVLTRSTVRTCVEVYRRHEPSIALAPEAEAFLRAWRGRLYLVTDGHKIVQRRKIDALGIRPRFEKIFITHQYGVRRAKPSPYCFELIKRAERCDWCDMVYVADNPAKDFVTLNALGCTTVRVLTGEHSRTAAKPGYEGRHRIGSLRELQPLLLAISEDAAAADHTRA